MNWSGARLAGMKSEQAFPSKDRAKINRKKSAASRKKYKINVRAEKARLKATLQHYAMQPTK